LPFVPGNAARAWPAAIAASASARTNADDATPDRRNKCLPRKAGFMADSS